MRRRRFLLSGSTLALAGVAGCLGGETTNAPANTTTESPTESPTDSKTDSPTASPTESPTDSPTDSPTEMPSTTIQNGSFESALDGWTVGKDLPEDPNNSGQPVDSDVRTTTQQAASGERALALEIDGSADDGTVWVQQQVDLSGVETLSLAGYSEKESFNEILKVAAYAGPVPEKGLSETDFDTSEHLADHEGWKTYEYPVEHDGPGLVAVGVSIVWETRALGILDDVAIE
ncbi:MAG: PT domain-containing protein [Halorhabdus sp.]